MDASHYSHAIREDGVLCDLHWRVRVSDRRRTIGLAADPGGVLIIAVPRGVSTAEVIAVVKARLPSVIRVMRHQAKFGAAHRVTEIANGEDFPHLGRPRRLLLVDTAEDDVVLRGDRLVARSGEPERVKTSIIAWYQRTGVTWLSARATEWALRLGVRPAGVRVDDLWVRWGQRTTDGEIVLHWAIFQLPPRLIDYAVVHELAHLAEPGHGMSFRRLVGRVLPDHDVRSAELADAGRKVWLGEIESGA